MEALLILHVRVDVELSACAWGRIRHRFLEEQLKEVVPTASTLLLLDRDPQQLIEELAFVLPSPNAEPFDCRDQLGVDIGDPGGLPGRIAADARLELMGNLIGVLAVSASRSTFAPLTSVAALLLRVGQSPLY